MEFFISLKFSWNFFAALRVSAQIFSALLLLGKFSSGPNFALFCAKMRFFKSIFIHFDRSSCMYYYRISIYFFA